MLRYRAVDGTIYYQVVRLSRLPPTYGHILAKFWKIMQAMSPLMATSMHYCQTMMCAGNFY